MSRPTWRPSRVKAPRLTTNSAVRMMIRRIAFALLFIGLLGVSAYGREKRFGYCQLQATGARVTNCTVTVYLTGGVTLATIYSDNLGTAQANPFTASAVTGLWSFYADNSRYDVQLSGGSPTISPAYTLSDFLFLDLGTAGQSQSIAGDLLPSITNSGNIGNASFIWGSGYLKLLTTTGLITANAGITSSGPNTLNGGGTFNGSFGGNPAFTGSPTFVTLTSSSASVAGSGNIRLAVGDSITWRNNANNADLNLGISTGDALAWGTSSIGIRAGNFQIYNNPAFALSGAIRLNTGDAVAWRNDANNADLLLSKSATDVLTWPNPLQANVFQTGTASPALTGIIRLASTDTLNWRNNAGNGDIAFGKNTADQFTISTALAATGSAAVLTGTGSCATITTQSGGAWAGNATCTGTTGASTFVITPGTTAPHSWQCDGADTTTTANILHQVAPLSATACTIGGTVNANDVITFKAFPY
jgi:hypothetical protein